MKFFDRAYRAARLLLTAKKSYARPRHVAILIYDENCTDLLRHFLGGLCSDVLHVRGERINLRVALSCIWNGEFSFLSYLVRYIDYVSPRMVLTFTDNSLHFFQLSKRLPGVRFVFIQNGWRGYHQDLFCQLDRLSGNDLKDLHVDAMFVFGKAVGAEYKKYVTGDVYPIGSLRSNLIPRSSEREPGLITFVSQWHHDGFYIDDVFHSFLEFIHRPNIMVRDALQELARASGKKIKVLMRNKNAQSRAYELEKKYYQELFGASIEFHDSDQRLKAYEIVDRSEIVVGVDSTLLYEALARGAKTAILSIRGDILKLPGFSFGWPTDSEPVGFFWSNVASKSAVETVLRNVTEVDDLRWREILESEGFGDLVACDDGNEKLSSSLKLLIGQ